MEMMAEAINSHPELQRYKILFISGNYSRILSRLNRNIVELDMSRPNTPFQLMTILKEKHHIFLIQGTTQCSTRAPRRKVGYLAQALKQTSRKATVLLYAPALDPRLQEMTELADRVCIYYEPAGAKGRAEARMTGEQRALEAYLRSGPGGGHRPGPSWIDIMASAPAPNQHIHWIPLHA